MYQLEGRCPERRSHLALEHYRTVRNADRFDSGGLLPTNGPAWEKMRKQFQVRVPGFFNVSKLYLTDKCWIDTTSITLTRL